MLRHYKERNDMKKGELKFAIQRWPKHLAVAAENGCVAFNCGLATVNSLLHGQADWHTCR